MRMIYQVTLKSRAAEWLGVPVASLAYLPFAEWSAIRDAYLAEQRDGGKS